MTQNVYGPPQQSIFDTNRYQGEFVTLNDLNEIVFSYSGPVSAYRDSAFWVPVRRSTIVQLVCTMRVPAAVALAVKSSVGDIALWNFDPSVNVMTFQKANTVPAGSAGGWVRCLVNPGNNKNGQDLAVMLRFLEIS